MNWFHLEYEWLDDGCLKTITKVLPAIRTDERTGVIYSSMCSAFKI